MDITWLGHASFRLKGKEVTVVTDPFDPGMVGIKYPKVEADIVTVSHEHPDHNLVHEVEGDPFVVRGAGEYEIKGVSVFGIPTFHDNSGGSERGQNTIFVIEIDDLKVCHLGDLGHTLTREQIEEIGSIDILLVPVGGEYTIGPKDAIEVITALEPGVVVPMHYKTDDLDEKTFGKLTSVDDFLKEMGVEKNVQAKLTVSKERMPEKMEVVVLERKS